jgi:hypothetical protein
MMTGRCSLSFIAELVRRPTWLDLKDNLVNDHPIYWSQMKYKNMVQLHPDRPRGKSSASKSQQKR